jgi:hypothetical protein
MSSLHIVAQTSVTVAPYEWIERSYSAVHGLVDETLRADVGDDRDDDGAHDQVVETAVVAGDPGSSRGQADRLPTP